MPVKLSGKVRVTMTNTTLAGVADALRNADNVVICGHVSPDGDAIGSQLALADALKALGKNATCLLAMDEDIDYCLRFLPGASQMVPAANFSGEFDTFITVDVPNAERMGQAAQQMHANAAHTVTIDHHIAEKPMSDVNYVDSEAAATALLIWELLKCLDITPTKDMATNCYAGILTDTGRFQYQNTTAEVLHVAADIVAHGADPADIAQHIYQNRSRPSLAIEQRMLANMQVWGNGAYVVSHLLRSDFVETGATTADAEPLIDALRSLRGIRVACLLRQQQGTVRGSLRAKDDTDVATIANRLGGGGHKAAAGFTFHGTIDEAIDTVRRELESL